MKKVFISYCRDDHQIVTEIANDLEATGNEVWYDRKQTGGVLWWNHILAKIQEFEVLMFVVSPNSLKSEACKSELSWAHQLKRFILPINFTQDIHLSLLPYPLNELHIVEYQQGSKNALFPVIHALNSMHEPPPLPNPLPTPPPLPISYLSNFADTIDSPEPLAPEKQKEIVSELGKRLGKEESHTDTLELIRRLKLRSDTIEMVALESDKLIKSHHHHPVVEHITQNKLVKWVSKSWKGNKDKVSIHEKRRNYICKPDQSIQIITDVKAFLESKGFTFQQINTEYEDMRFKIKLPNLWRRITHFNTFFEIIFRQSGDRLTVEIANDNLTNKLPIAAQGGLIGLMASVSMHKQKNLYENHYCPTKIGFKTAVTLDYKGLEAENTSFPFRG